MFKVWKFSDNDVSNNVVVYSKISRNDAISCSRHFSPFNMWILNLKLKINFLNGFSNNLQTSNQRP